VAIVVPGLFYKNIYFAANWQKEQAFTHGRAPVKLTPFVMELCFEPFFRERVLKTSYNLA
jgi:hypothetical protein